LSDNSLKLSRCDDMAYINLRGDPSNKAFLDGVRSATGLRLPLDPNTVAGGEHAACWLGPDEWVLLTESGNADAIVQALGDALQGQHVAINNLSGGQVTFRLSGANARDVLAQGCTLDFHPQVFAPGTCAQTGSGKASVMIKACDDNAGFDLLVRRSFSDYLWQWLLRAGRAYRIEVV